MQDFTRAYLCRMMDFEFDWTSQDREAAARQVGNGNGSCFNGAT